MNIIPENIKNKAIEINVLLNKVDSILGKSISTTSTYIDSLLENEDILISFLNDDDNENKLKEKLDYISNSQDREAFLLILEEQEKVKQIVKGLLEMIVIQKDNTNNIISNYQQEKKRTQDVKEELIKENKELLIDPITNLQNLQGLLQELKSIIKNIEKFDTLNIGLLNLDNFTHLKNVFGFTGSNTILKYFANFLQYNLGTEAEVYRVGGEQFVIISNKNNLDEILYTLCKKAENTKLTSSNQTQSSIKITFTHSTLSKSDIIGIKEEQHSLSDVYNTMGNRLYSDILSKRKKETQ